MSVESNFLENKKNSMQKLAKAKKEKLADVDIIPILDIINSSEAYYTTSSCFGRIVLLQLPIIGDKKNAKFVGKWHRQIDVEEINSALNEADKGQLWLLAQSSIIHVGCKTVEAADKILKIAYSCGFKHSGYKSLENRLIVEICSTERLDAPVGQDAELFCSKKHLDLLVNISNQIIEKSTAKLDKLKEELGKSLSIDKTTIN